LVKEDSKAIIFLMDQDPIAVGYQAGAILGLLLGGFLADTWLGFAVVALSSAAGGTLLGFIFRSLRARLSDTGRQ